MLTHVLLGLAGYVSKKHKLDLTTDQELYYKTLYEQMCERYDTLDKKMREIEPVYNQLLMTQLPGFENMTITPNQPSELMRVAGNKALDRIKTEPDMMLADRAYYVYIDMLAQAQGVCRQENKQEQP